MESIKKGIIKGFNEVVQTVQGVAQQYPEQQHLITLVTFNGMGIKTMLENEDVQRLEEIDGDKYKPGSSTPLYDAMGESIHRLRKVSDLIPDSHVLVTILTDGEENASREYSGRAIKKLVEELELRNWTFTYIGTNHDVEKSAMTISIKNSIHFVADDAGMDKVFASEKKSRLRYSEKIRMKENTAEGYYEPDTEGETKDSEPAT